MSEVIRCDWCGATSKPDAMVNWFALERVGFRITTDDESGGPWHFCSPVCLQGWGFHQCQIAGVSVQGAEHP